MLVRRVSFRPALCDRQFERSVYCRASLLTVQYKRWSGQRFRIEPRLARVDQLTSRRRRRLEHNNVISLLSDCYSSVHCCCCCCCCSYPEVVHVISISAVRSRIMAVKAASASTAFTDECRFISLSERSSTVTVASADMKAIMWTCTQVRQAVLLTQQIVRNSRKGRNG
jgi:hypothetical protein